MKKLSNRRRNRNKRQAYLHRTQSLEARMDRRSREVRLSIRWRRTNAWIEKHLRALNVKIDKDRNVTLTLPKKMNFSTHYNETALHIEAIRRLAISGVRRRHVYRLTAVNFDDLRRISSSAALVLTAELSRWDDLSRQHLRPLLERWDTSILHRFRELGFFELFHNNPMADYTPPNEESKNVQFVKYIKGESGDNKKTKLLKKSIHDIVGDDISKWVFLNTGLSEAITNVSHHAYPKEGRYGKKNWYLSGGFNSAAKEFKIVFYDQGVGIPKSLPTSKIWERVLEHLSVFAKADRKKDEVLLKAAIELDRTSTGDSDRGKGIQDMLEFIRQRKNGYISILSRRGLYKYSVDNGKKSTKSVHFEYPILGTLIIWKVSLN